nr:hypothetical protein [Tanacetum cinerariifolium]
GRAPAVVPVGGVVVEDVEVEVLVAEVVGDAKREFGLRIADDGAVIVVDDAVAVHVT